MTLLAAANAVPTSVTSCAILAVQTLAVVLARPLWKRTIGVLEMDT